MRGSRFMLCLSTRACLDASAYFLHTNTLLIVNFFFAHGAEKINSARILLIPPSGSHHYHSGDGFFLFSDSSWLSICIDVLFVSHEFTEK